MNNTLKTKYLKRIDELLELCIFTAKSSYGMGGDDYDVPRYIELKTATESLLLNVVGKNSPHYKNFQKSVEKKKEKGSKIEDILKRMSGIVGVLNALKSDLERDSLGKVEDLVRAEVFTDFLEMAQHLLETGYKDPAATLVGSVLENGLKKLAEENDIQYKNNDGIGALNKALAKAKVYTHPKKQQIQAWADIRNSAAHGKPDEYKTTDVEYMLEGVRNFLTEHPE